MPHKHCQTHKSSSTELLPGPIPTSTPAKSFLSRKALIHHSMGLPQATAPESSGNPSLASDQLSGRKQVTSLSKPQFPHLQNRVLALALITSHAKVAQRSHVEKRKCDEKYMSSE